MKLWPCGKHGPCARLQVVSGPCVPEAHLGRDMNSGTQDWSSCKMVRLKKHNRNVRPQSRVWNDPGLGQPFFESFIESLHLPAIVYAFLPPIVFYINTVPNWNPKKRMGTGFLMWTMFGSCRGGAGRAVLRVLQVRSSRTEGNPE